MKREDILFYLSTNRVKIYLYKSKKEYEFNIDTSLFFKYGEIKDVEECNNVLSKLLSKINFGVYILKPNIYILYNDVCHCDIKFLYKIALESFNYNNIFFVSISDIVEMIRPDSNVVVFDKNYYTDMKRGEKIVKENVIEKSSIFIGKKESEHVHYSDIDILWNEFKTCFTNRRSYGMIGLGDDGC